jgi:hypothetical protein
MHPTWLSLLLSTVKHANFGICMYHAIPTKASRLCSAYIPLYKRRTSSFPFFPFNSEMLWCTDASTSCGIDEQELVL